MSGEIIRHVAEEGAIIPSPALDQVREFVRASKAPNTVRGYRSDWRDFSAWCERNGALTVPATPEAVASYIAECAGRLKVGSIQRRLNAISQAHQAAGCESPTHAPLIRNTMKGIRRTLGTAQTQKSPALTDTIRSMIEVTGCGLIGFRDRAVILLGFAGAFRRSEIAALEYSDGVFDRNGLTINLRRSKTDQVGAGRQVGIPYGSNPLTCPVRALHDWIEHAGIADGFLFRPVNKYGRVQNRGLAGADIALIVKKLCTRAGLDASKYAGHSLRSGHCTAAAIAGVAEYAIQRQTGHRSIATLRKYVRDGDLFRNNSAGRLGL